MVGAFFPVQPIKATEFCLVKAFLSQNQVTGQVDKGNGLLFSFHEEKSSQVITVLTAKSTLPHSISVVGETSGSELNLWGHFLYPINAPSLKFLTQYLNGKGHRCLCLHSVEIPNQSEQNPIEKWK